MTAERLGVGETVERLRSGELGALELTERSLERATELDRAHNAFRVICSESALEEARRADAALAEARDDAPAPPLLGVPMAIKDDVDLAGHSTPFGCAAVARVAERDAEVVRRLRAAGAVIVGKTHAPEIGQWHFTETVTFGATTNPWNSERSPGGSSGGAAAAVAAGAVAAAIGSDGAGSIRIPAAWTGLVGIKPQRGRVSTWPDPEPFEGLSCYGPLARTAEDAALVLEAIRGNVPGDLHRPPDPPEPYPVSAGREPRPMRIALSFATPAGVPDRVDPEIEAATSRIATRLEELGHAVEPADPPYGPIGAVMIPRGMAGVHRWIEANVTDRSRLEPRTRTHAACGRVLSGLPLWLARRAEPALRRRIATIFERFDAVLTPTTAKRAPLIDRYQGQSYWPTSSSASSHCPFAWAWNVTGWPGVNVPAGVDSCGVPIGAQLLGRPNDEGTLLALTAQLQEAERWQDRRPPTAA